MGKWCALGFPLCFVLADVVLGVCVLFLFDVLGSLMMWNSIV